MSVLAPLLISSVFSASMFVEEVAGFASLVVSSSGIAILGTSL